MGSLGEKGPPMAIERRYTIAELSAMSGIPKRTLQRAAQRGWLQTDKPNGSSRGQRATEAAFERYLKGGARK